MTSPPPCVLEIPPAVEADLRHTRDYIARSNPEAATRLVAKVFGTLRLLRDAPEIGPRVPDRNDHLRCITIPGFRAYRLYYQHDGARNRLRLVRLLHTARDADDLLPG